MTPENSGETRRFLAGHQLPYVCVDMPQGHSIPPVLAATCADLAVVRMHGHSGKWDSKDIHERFGYRYSTLGYQDTANLDTGDAWPVTYALNKWTPAVEKKVAELVTAAVS